MHSPEARMMLCIFITIGIVSSTSLPTCLSYPAPTRDFPLADRCGQLVATPMLPIYRERCQDRFLCLGFSRDRRLRERIREFVWSVALFSKCWTLYIYSLFHHDLILESLELFPLQFSKEFLLTSLRSVAPTLNGNLHHCGDTLRNEGFQLY
jgi:hypothetical protein